MEFIIRKLDKMCYERQDGAHPARSQLHCFFYLKEGTVLVDIGEKTYFIQADDLVIIPAGQIFKVRYYEKSQGYMGGFAPHFVMSADGQGSGMSKFAFLRVWGYPKILLDQKTSERINLLFERIYEENLMKSPNREIIGAYLTAMLVEAQTLYNQELPQGVGRGESLCNRFLDMLFHSPDLQLKMSVAEYAERLNITPNHLNKVIKGITGKSPSGWIEEAIMVRAKMLLRNTSKPLSEIASELGMDDQSYFARRFKKHEGVTPTQFRSLSASRQK